jgi:hypothetical protein
MEDPKNADSVAKLEPSHPNPFGCISYVLEAFWDVSLFSGPCKVIFGKKKKILGL